MKFFFYLIFCAIIMAVSPIAAQEELQVQQPEIVQLTDEVFERSAGAMVKLVADSGRRIGAGVLLGVHKDDIGFILTTYSMVVNRDKVAVILRDYNEPLLGNTVERWVDFDLDLAIIGVKNFPKDQTVVMLANMKSPVATEQATVVGHDDLVDWLRYPVQLSEPDDSEAQHFFVDMAGNTLNEGSILIDSEGAMLGMLTGEKIEGLQGEELFLAVRTDVIKPIIKEWFQSIQLAQKWDEEGSGLPTWIWAVGGGVIGGTIATAIAITGGDDGSPVGLPRPPNPPNEQ